MVKDTGAASVRSAPLSQSPSALSVLQYREFRLLWTGQVLSMVGSRMQQAALLWHIYEITHSPVALGLMGLARVVPIVIFALAGGVVADAWDRRRLMLVSQSALACLAAALGVWSVTGLRSAWPIYTVAALSAAVLAFDSPARQSLMPSLVPRERLANALSLNSLSSQLASILGPALMGLVIGQLGVGWVYCLNAASFLAVIGALLLMRPIGPAPHERPAVSFAAALDGLTFMRNAQLLLSLMLLDFLATFFSSASALLPIYAKDILHAGPGVYGWLVASTSIGSLAAAAGLTLTPPIRRQGLVVLWAVFMYGVATVVFGISSSFWPCFLALAGTGAADTVSTVLRQTIRQLVTPDALRGRMTSINLIFFQGGPQLGELEAGLVAAWLGAPLSVVTGGLGCLITVALVALRSPALRDYREAPIP